MKNWKTSLSGIVTVAAGFVLFSPETFAHYPVVVQLAKYIGAGGLLALGFSGKDASTHSTVAEVASASPDNVSSVSMSSSMAVKQSAQANVTIPDPKPAEQKEN